MIIYSLLKNMEYSINACTDGHSVVYDITGFTSDDIDIINMIPSEQDVVIYGKTYKVITYIPDDKNISYKDKYQIVTGNNVINESALKSNIDKDYKSKGNKSLSSFTKKSIDDNFIKKYTNNLITSIK